jgi:hypothetical protein
MKLIDNLSVMPRETLPLIWLQSTLFFINTIGKCMSVRLCGNLASQLEVLTEPSFFALLTATRAQKHNFWALVVVL